jgi:hypothetical protein
VRGKSSSAAGAGAGSSGGGSAPGAPQSLVRLHGLDVTPSGRLVLTSNVAGVHALALPQRWTPSAHAAGLFGAPAFRAAVREVVRGSHARSGSPLARLPREALERVLAMAAFPQGAWFRAPVALAGRAEALLGAGGRDGPRSTGRWSKLSALGEAVGMPM